MSTVKTRPEVIRPSIVEDAHLSYLHALRESGAINIFGAAGPLGDEFNLLREDARVILKYWMESFVNER